MLFSYTQIIINLNPHNKLFIFIFLTVLLGQSGCKVFYNPNAKGAVQQPVIRQSEEGNYVVVRAGGIYEANAFKRFWFGDHYRDIWNTPVRVPVLDLNAVHGGLSILEKGGGMQTYSLKLKGGDGKLYSLRSVQKDPTPVLPIPLQYSFADEIVQDQISASHPYGPYILPTLGDAAGIYHTNPVLYYLPDNQKLGEYRKEYGGALVMLEEDPDEDWSDYEDFGFTRNAVSTETVLEALREDQDNEVDQEAFLRLRLFDIWINDWDRHGGQFRWGEFEVEDQTVYRPIPEDRDNMLFKFDGVIPWVISRKWAMRKFQDFQPETRDIAGLNHNARYVDRRFLTEMAQEDWLMMARDLQERLTNEKIREAMTFMPDTIQAINGQELTDMLEARKYNLEKMALEYYKILAKQVDVVGRDDSEYFEVHRQQGGITKVIVYESDEDGEKERQIYERIFYYPETEEIRLYGLGSRDHFVIDGSAEEAPVIRVIGGEGNDRINNSSSVYGWEKMTVFYDTEAGNEITEVTEDNDDTRLLLSHNQEIVRYDMESFAYDRLAPMAMLGYNSDDRLFIGAGVSYTTHGFNRYPYASHQEFMVHVSPKRNAGSFEYTGDFIKVIRSLGVNVNARLRWPNFFSNFYGYGNETEIVEDPSYYEVLYNEIKINPSFTLDGRNSRITFGPQYWHLDAKRQEDSFIANDPNLSEDAFEGNNYLGFRFTSDVRTIEDIKYPEEGVWWISSLEVNAQTNNSKSKLSSWSTELRGFYTLELPIEMTIAARIGGGMNSGDFNFYQAQTIGGNRGFNTQGTVRGLARDRYSGRSALYQNIEVRAPIVNLPFYFVPVQIGAYAFLDNGRVWNDGMDSRKWHTSFGGGVFLRPFGMFVTTLGVARAEKNTRVYLNLGFMF